MKVLIASRGYVHKGGGGGVSAKYLCQALSKMGLDLIVLAPASDFQWSYEKREDFELYRLPTLGNSFLTQIPSFAFFSRKLLSSLTYDLIYTETLIFTDSSTPVTTHFRGPKYGSYRATKVAGQYAYSLALRFGVALDKLMANRSDVVMVGSDEVRAKVFDWCSPKRVEVLPNGIDLSLFHPIGPDREFSGKHILYMGRLDPVKRVEDLVEAFKLVSDEIEADLTIVGDGLLRKELEARGKGYSNVNFTGYVSHKELVKYYNMADLFVLPSSYEPFGNVILEAMACGTPTILSDSCSAQFGLPIFRTFDVEDLAEKMLTYLESPSKLKRLSNFELVKVKEYSWEKVAKKLVSIWNTIL